MSEKKDRKDDDWIFAWLAEPVDDWQLKTDEKESEESTTLEYTPASLVGHCDTHGIIELTPSGGFVCEQCDEDKTTN